MQKPLGAQISHMLKDRGVDVIFGIPGVHNQEMYRGIEEAGITHVLARHEQGAGFMADGYARATGKPGVAYVITGPGLCNIMTPMGQAYSDSVPMLVISSCLDETAARKGQLHQMKDQRAAAETVCDWSEEARTAEAAYALVDRAMLEFDTRRPRPKHIQVPIAVLEAQADDAPRAVDQSPTPGIDAASIEQIARELRKAHYPIVVFGGGAATGGVTASIERLLERFRPATFTTYAGRGVVPVAYELNFGSNLARPSSAEIFAKADYVLTVGTSLAETDLWRQELGHHCNWAQINIDPTDMVTGPGRSVSIVADGAEVLSLICAGQTGEGNARWSANDVAGLRARWRDETDAERPGIVPICDALRDVVPADTMIYSDMTQFAYVAKEVWDMDRPGHWHHPYGFGTLGYATPAAIGGAVARRGKPTMAIIGDYGFHYTMQELGVAVELGLSLPIILWDNGKLKEIEDSMVRGQIAPNAVVARNPDFCKLAEAFGAGSVAPKTLPELQDAVRAAFENEGPTLIYITPDLTR
ncbi:thiamine pyrophosphate-binding protein [uncultured Roseobacter sp.]|uniref:thiamine pyrophosphate-binding protein n=1 Tax=uncultured Roseobacter sp. TaxID=114847 RepID=UPI00261AE1DC|nr:thiamine pyrophosphate-binding protein [uncultured Roseobacter sp.]